MKLAIIGGNGKVGTELCFHFREEPDFELVPVARNVLGSVFLASHGFECRIADVGREEDARELLGDMDVIVISSYADTPGPTGYNANRALIENCIRFAKPSCKSIYFSTIRAFGARVETNPDRLAIPNTYDRRKRQMEKLFLRGCQRAGLRGIALRLGHVFGQNQPRPRMLRRLLAENDVVKVKVAPDIASNVVHTVTIKDCIQLFARTETPADVYSLVNAPQWTWREVLEYYNHTGTELIFEDPRPPREPLPRQVIKGVMQTLESRRENLREIRQYLPLGLDRKLQRRFLVPRMKAEVAHLDDRDLTVLRMHEFAYRPIPGKKLHGLTDTRTLLDREHISDGTFG